MFLSDDFVPTPLHTLLRSLSHTLESLHTASGHDALLLVVSPTDHTDGWLGGTSLGREFWRDLRGGGIVGARAFKAMSRAAYLNEPNLDPALMQERTQEPETPINLKDLTSRQIKAELYRCMRDNLRFFDPISSYARLSFLGLHGFKAGFRRSNCRHEMDQASEPGISLWS